MLFLSELGNRLKEARVAKGWSIEELQEVTKIQTRYLVGIEEGNYSMMPGQFYARAFIKQYAEAVDLSPEELFEEFKEEVPATINDEIPEKLSRVTSRKTVSAGSSKVFDILPTVLIILLVIGVCFLVWYFFTKGDNPDTAPNNKKNNEAIYQESDKLKENEDKKDTAGTNKEQTNDGEEEKASEEEQTPKQEVSVVQTQGRNTEYELKNAEKFDLKIVSTGATWVNIQNGKGYSFFQGILKKGETDSKMVDFSKETEAVITIGNSGETEIYINDEKVEFAVSPSTTVRQDITIRYNKENE
ncbi:MAG: RodZ domain-containing protein [Bacillus sp. (in: firmicutes)]